MTQHLMHSAIIKISCIEGEKERGWIPPELCWWWQCIIRNNIQNFALCIKHIITDSFDATNRETYKCSLIFVLWKEDKKEKVPDQQWMHILASCQMSWICLGNVCQAPKCHLIFQIVKGPQLIQSWTHCVHCGLNLDLHDLCTCSWLLFSLVEMGHIICITPMQQVGCCVHMWPCMAQSCIL